MNKNITCKQQANNIKKAQARIRYIDYSTKHLRRNTYKGENIFIKYFFTVEK